MGKKEWTVFWSALVLASYLGTTLFLTGCGATEGWQLNLGVTPITHVEDRRELSSRDAQGWRAAYKAEAKNTY